MKISGIICEYNPFHNGHKYHIDATRKNGATHIVAIMSGNFVQRGDVAIMDKFERSKLAVQCGVDLVVELPVAYSLSTAETFARGAVHLLNSLGCVRELSFGSECGDLPLLLAAVQASKDFSNSEELRALLEGGMSYPSALSQLVEKRYGKQVADIFQGANNELAVEYIKAISHHKARISPFTITRKSALHDGDEKTSEYASASFIRKSIAEGTDFSDLVPPETVKAIFEALKSGKFARVEFLDRMLLYRLRTATLEEIAELPDVGQGLENRIFAAKGSCTMNELFTQIKTKRYTLARIRRILFNLFIGIKASDLEELPPYGRILATNERGFEILSEAKGKATIPFGTSLSKLGDISDTAERFAELESRSTDIYSLACKKIQPSGVDYTSKVSIVD